MKIKVYDVLLWIFFILAVVFFFWYIFGNSPTFEQTLLIFILGGVMANGFRIHSVSTKLSTRLHYLEKSFSALARDFKQHIKHK